MAGYRVDGIFINRWSGSGMCYCEHCREGFQKASGHDLPHTNDPADPARRAFIVWQQVRLFALWRQWDLEVRKINPDSCVIPNTGGGRPAARHEDHWRACPHPVCRPPGAQRGNASLGQWQEREEYRATMATSRSAASSAWAWRRPTAGKILGPEPCRDPCIWAARCICQRPSALVHQVLRHLSEDRRSA